VSVCVYNAHEKREEEEALISLLQGVIHEGVPAPCEPQKRVVAGYERPSHSEPGHECQHHVLGVDSHRLYAGNAPQGQKIIRV
jgi:hypothetical protein